MFLKIFWVLILVLVIETPVVASSKVGEFSEKERTLKDDIDLSSIFFTAPLSFSRTTLSNFESGLAQAKLPSSLRVEFSDIGDMGAKLIAKCPALDTINGLMLDRCSLTSSGVKTLMDGSFVKNLVALSLSGSAIKDEGVSVLSIKKHSIPLLFQLRRLDLMRCGLTACGVSSLLSGGLYTHEFRSLWLSGNEIGDKGAFEIAQSLSDGRLLRLESLGIAKCGIGKKGFLAIARAILDRKTTIQTIFMAQNPIDFEEDETLAALEQLKEHGDNGVSIFWVKDGRLISNFG